MQHRYIKKDRTEKKGNYVTISTGIEKIENSIGDLEEHRSEKGPILFLIFLAIGAILSLMVNNYCALTGNAICISTCGFVCSWVFFSAVLSHNETNSFSGTSEFS
jgi:hypothetical protein